MTPAEQIAALADRALSVPGVQSIEYDTNPTGSVWNFVFEGSAQVRNLARAQRAERHERRKAASAERFAAVVGTLGSLESEELALLAEGRPMLFQTISVWAGIKRHGEAGERMVPHAARAILTERAEQRARELRAAIRDEWDNLPDAEPSGIVPRGGV